MAGSMLLGGCGDKDTDTGRTEIDFTIAEDKELPDELAQIIESRKAEGFTLSFDSEGYTYIAVGYGTQSTGGYSIRANEVYETDTAIGIHTTLIGPSAGEAVNKKESYPYIVIKIEYRDKEIEFTV